jgi:hypothetical protein
MAARLMKEKPMAKNASLFGDLLKDDGELQAELAKTAVAADLAVLAARSGSVWAGARRGCRRC